MAMSLLLRCILLLVLVKFGRLQTPDQFAACSIYGSKCSSGQCILPSSVCNNVTDCADGSDELNCDAPQCQLHNEFMCADEKKCYHILSKCDNITDCEDGSDEWNCTYACDGVENVQCPDGTCIPHIYVCDRFADCAYDRTSQAFGVAPADEANCLTHTRSRCADGETRCVLTHRCVRNEWRCDGEADCALRDDELQCSATGIRCSRSNTYRCINVDQCVDMSSVCDGVSDCADGSDEALPSCRRACSVGQYRCASGACVDAGLVCNGFTDCQDASDEPDFWRNLTLCRNRFPVNMSAIPDDCTNSMVCVTTGSCAEGYTAIFNGSICIDRDECSRPGQCSQQCSNRPGGFSCNCSSGYALQNGTVCVPSGPDATFLIANEVDIRVVAGGVDSVLLRNRRSAVAVDFHYTRDLLFWSEAITGGIYSSDLQGRNPRLIVNALLASPEGVAVDWVHDRLYWSDTVKGRLETSLLDGSERVTLLSSRRFKPQAIALDPCNHHVYWTDVGEVPRVERSNLDGSARVSIHALHLYWPSALTLDLDNRLMYWSDNKLHTIEVSNMDGSSRRLLVSQGLQHPFAMSQFAGSIYWTDLKLQTLSTSSQFVAGNSTVLTQRLYVPTDVKVLHPLRQKPCAGEGAHPCHRNCSYTCISTSDELGACACPPGRTLLADGVTCEAAPNTSVAFTSNDGMRRLSLDTSPDIRLEIPLVTLPAGLHHIRFADVFVSEDSSRSYVFMVDTSLNKVYRSDLDGANLTTIVSTLASPTGIAVDYINENLYIADNVRGVIVITDFNGANLRTILSGLSNPRDLAIWPERNLLFYADAQSLRLQSVNLIGQQRTTQIQFIFDAALLVTVDKENSLLYCITLGLQFQGFWQVPVGGGTVKRFLPSDVRSVYTVRGMAVLGSTLFYSDRLTSSLYAANMTTTGSVVGTNRLLSGIDAIGDVLVVPSPRNGNGSVCAQDNGNCPAGTICTTVDRTINNKFFRDIALCLCADGAAGCQDDINECSLPDSCSPSANCTNTLGSFTCSDQAEECRALVSPCPVHQRCIETPRAFYCSNCSATQYTCLSDGACIDAYRKCDGVHDCLDGSDERRCSQGLCQSSFAKCADGGCIFRGFWCDGVNDCADNSDETDCAAPRCHTPHEYTCANGDCYLARYRCDGGADCVDGSDEWNCTYGCNGTLSFRCRTGHVQCLPPAYACDGVPDCDDRSDEDNCGSSLQAIHCISGETRCSGRKLCIKDTWYCDGDVDCAFGSDEPRDCAANCDPKTHFKCLNSDTCVLLSMLCDGTAQCPDGSDEALPSCGSCAGGTTEFKCSDNRRCVSATKLCDGLNDCGDWSDEISSSCPPPTAPRCGTASSNRTAFVCRASCLIFPATCCPDGYSRLTDGFCYDVDECSSAGRPCSQRCSNTPGNFTCSCASGYSMTNATGLSCSRNDTSIEPVLLIANTRDILRYNLDTGHFSPLVSNQRYLTSMDFHWELNYLFWTDAISGNIYRSDRSGHHTKVLIHTQLSSPSSLAVDWVHGSLYWTDSVQGRIESSDLEGQGIVVLLSAVRFKPQAIAVAPCHDYMFWTDFGDKPQIERSFLDGSSRVAIHSARLYWPSALTLDLDNELVYWSDNKLHTVEYSRFDGSDRTLLLALDVQHPFALSLFEGRLYWVDWHNQSVLTHSQWTTGRLPQKVAEGLYVPSDIKVMHPLRQAQCIRAPGSHDHCEQVCSYRCLSSNETASPPYSCLCGPQQSRLVSSGRVQCATEIPTLIFTSSDSGLRRLSPSSRVSEIVASNARPLFVATAVQQAGNASSTEIYWTNVDREIAKTGISGKEPVTILRPSQGYSVAGLAVDWTTGLIFCVDRPRNARISLFDPVSGQTRALVTNLPDPRDIIVWPQRGLIFWTDVSRGGIYRANMDGSDSRLVIAVDNAFGLALDQANTRLYWTAFTGHDTLRSASIDGTGLKSHLDTTNYIIGLTLLANDLIWIDSDDETINRISLSNSSDREVIQRSIGQPLLIVSAPSPYQLAHPTSVCSGYSCSDGRVCVARSAVTRRGESVTVPVCLCLSTDNCSYEYQGCADASVHCGGVSTCINRTQPRTGASVSVTCECPSDYSFNAAASECLDRRQCSPTGLCFQVLACSPEQRTLQMCGDESECMTLPALPGGGGSPLPACQCPSGYTYYSDVSQCLDAEGCRRCGDNAVCSGSLGAKTCQCQNGFSMVPCDGSPACRQSVLTCVNRTVNSASSSSSTADSIGLAIGIPLALFIIALATVVVIYWYRRTRLNRQFRHSQIEALSNASAYDRSHEGSPSRVPGLSSEPKPRTIAVDNQAFVGMGLADSGGYGDLSMANPMYDSFADDIPLATHESLPTLDNPTYGDVVDTSRGPPAAILAALKAQHSAAPDGADGEP